MKISAHFNNIYFRNDSKKSHNKAIDGLRGLAVLMVVFAHLNKNIPIDFPLNFIGMGGTGVYLFFILSSYLLDKQIAMAITSNNSTKFYWLNYFLRRFLRIYPLYIAVLLVYYILPKLGIRYCICIDTINVFFRHLTLRQANGVFWSIPVEFIYYFISPIIMLFYAFVLKWKKWLVYITTAVIIIGISYFTYTNGYFKAPVRSTIPFLPIFLTGSLLAVYEVLYHKKITKNNFYRIALDVLGIFSLAAILIFTSFSNTKFFIGQEGRSVFVLFRHLTEIQAILFLLIIIATIYGKGFIKQIFSFKPLRFIGVISFSVYLIHYPIIELVKNLPFTTAVQYFLYFVITIVVCSFSYWAIENPFSKIHVFDKEKLLKKN